MKNYNPKIHHRRSIRLKGYDYSQAGLYFITICCQDGARLFGRGEPACSPVEKMGEHGGSQMGEHGGSQMGEHGGSQMGEHGGSQMGEHGGSQMGEHGGSQMGEHIGSPVPMPREMILNDAGRMVEKWYYELENKFPDIKCHAMVVMPNHFHCIVENVGGVGADLRVCPGNDTRVCPITPPDLSGGPGEHVDGGECIDGGECVDGVEPFDGSDYVGSPDENMGDYVGSPDEKMGEHVGSSGEHMGEHGGSPGEHVGSPLRAVVQWFKTMTTNEYIRGVKNLGWKRFNGKLWQRNYWEHIIRDEKSYENISKYIMNNPAKWNDDKFYNI